MPVFEYGARETDYLSSRDRKMAAVIARVGHIERETDPDVFSAVVHHIIGQQVSMKAQQTIWTRMKARLGEINAETILSVPPGELRALGMNGRKEEYITDFARRVQTGEFDIKAVQSMSDAEAVSALASLKGVGVWTAEMILLFCLGREDILSYDDLAIQRGLRMIYRHRKIDRALFEKYRRRFSPFGSTASLYIWAVACGAMPELTDPAQKKKAAGK